MWTGRLIMLQEAELCVLGENGGTPVPRVRLVFRPSSWPL